MSIFFPGPATPATIQVLVDNQLTNLLSTSVSGFDFSLSYKRDLLGGTWGASFDGNVPIDFVLSGSPGSPKIQEAGTVYFPPSFRGRIGSSFEATQWGVNIFVNITSGGTDTRSGVDVPVGSWTTLDAILHYAPGSDVDFINGLTLSLVGTNLLDTAPPTTNCSTGTCYDSANASALGRVIAIELTKSW